MDDPELDEREHRRALTGLARLNRASRAAAAIWRTASQIPAPEHRPIRILDIACGSGDVTTGIARLGAASKLDVEVVGCDISPVAVAAARARASSIGIQGKFFVCDALSDDLPNDYDILTCSLFLHHLTDEQADTLLQSMRRVSRCGFVISDLVRSTPGLMLAGVASRAFTRSRVVHTDALRSVRAAFTVPEIRALADSVGLRGASIGRVWPCRYILSWSRTA